MPVIIKDFFQVGHFPALINFPDFPLTFPDVYDIPATVQIGLGVLLSEQESMHKFSP